MEALKKKDLPPLPTRRRQTRLAQAEVDIALYTIVRKEMKARDIKIRQVIEWGLKAWLLNTNPKAAKEFWIPGED